MCVCIYICIYGFKQISPTNVAFNPGFFNCFFRPQIWTLRVLKRTNLQYIYIYIYGLKKITPTDLAFNPGFFNCFLQTPDLDSTSSETHESAIKIYIFCHHDNDFLLLPPPLLPTIKPCPDLHQSSKVLGNSAEMAAARPAWIRYGSWTHNLSYSPKNPQNHHFPGLYYCVHFFFTIYIYIYTYVYIYAYIYLCGIESTRRRS